MRHNADPHVDFLGVQQGINNYVVRNGRVVTYTAFGTYESVTSFLRYGAQLPGTPKCSPAQTFWWELRDIYTGELIYTPARYAQK
ncbi:hypothetical protein P1P68_02180 [Streptomyces scabiei]|uniref:hypothetical protein n=1 Tax=Streptomyces scabiei TaxID=1930 RepID=UPI002990559C|nr:hypothetical protein [Streptomyces scabiei]MDW8803642.1 hypothetical protein [Streptomyces scabiei]